MANIKVLSRTQRIVVGSNKTISVVGIGDTSPDVDIFSSGPPGPPGMPGLPGSPGTNAGRRWYGEGEPGVIIGAEPGDEYLDMSTGNLYVLQ